MILRIDRQPALPHSITQRGFHGKASAVTMPIFQRRLRGWDEAPLFPVIGSSGVNPLL